MIYITGDTHCDFKRFTKKERLELSLEFTINDYMIICGDFGLIWEKNGEFRYNLRWLSELPFTILWVQGNHENYNMIEEYQLEEWNGGKVRHIVRDKIILLERGQVFDICGKTIFSFGELVHMILVAVFLIGNLLHLHKIKEEFKKTNLVIAY